MNYSYTKMLGRQNLAFLTNQTQVTSNRIPKVWLFFGCQLPFLKQDDSAFSELMSFKLVINSKKLWQKNEF